MSIRTGLQVWRLRGEVFFWRIGMAWVAAAGLLMVVLCLWLYVWTIGAGRLSRLNFQVQGTELAQAAQAHRNSLRAFPSEADVLAQQDQILLNALRRVAVSERALGDVLQRVNSLARRQGLEVATTDFQTKTDGFPGLQRLQVAFSAAASYLQVKRLVASLSGEFPNVAIEQLQLRRESLAQVQGRLNLTLGFWFVPEASEAVAAAVSPSTKPRWSEAATHAVGRDPFAHLEWTQAPPIVRLPAATDQPPEMPFVYLGKKLEDGEWEVYLGHAGQTLLARPGSVLASVYRVEAIAPPRMQLTYLPLGLSQDLLVGDNP